MTIRKPTRNAKKQPPCFGRPTLLNVGCVACAARPACCAALSARFTRVTVFDRPRTPKVGGLELSDKVASIWGEAGVDFALWVPFGHALSAYKCAVKRGKSPYLIQLSYDGRFVLGVTRMDERTGVCVHVRGRGVFDDAEQRMVNRRRVFVFEGSASAVDRLAPEVAKAVALYILKIAFTEEGSKC